MASNINVRTVSQNATRNLISEMHTHRQMLIFLRIAESAQSDTLTTMIILKSFKH